MYSVSKEMPLQSYQIVSPSENQTDFQPGQIVRFTIPRSTGYFDAHLSKLQFQVKTSGATYKYCYNSPTAGIASMIDMVRLSQGGTVISEITDYNQLMHFVKGYENCLSVAQKEALVDGVVDYHRTTATKAKCQTDGMLLGQGLNRSGDVSAAAMQQDVKFQMSLDFVSLFEMLHVVPMLAMGDLLLEIRLAQDVFQIMKVHPSTSITHTCAAIAANNTVTLSPPFLGFSNLADSPFIVGQSLQIFDAAGNPVAATERAIASMSQAPKTGVITITTGGAVFPGPAVGETLFKITKDTDGNVDPATAPDFVVSRAELLLQIVKPPDSYTQSLASSISGGGYMVDVPTVTTYRGTVLANIKNQTLTLPTTQSRAKAFFTVLRSANQAPSFKRDNSSDFDYSGKFNDLRFYRSQIDGQFYPNQPVDNKSFIGGLHFSQEHIRELQKAADSADIPMRTLEGAKQNYVIGRALSHMDSSTNLVGTPINLYLEYNGNTGITAKDAISFVFHTTRISVTPEGVEVMA